MVGDTPELLESVEPMGALLPIEGAGVPMPLLGAGVSVEGVVRGAGAGTTFVSSTFLLQAPRASNAVNATAVAARVLNFDVNMRVSFSKMNRPQWRCRLASRKFIQHPRMPQRTRRYPLVGQRLVPPFRCNLYACHHLMRQPADDGDQTNACQQPCNLCGSLGQRGTLLQLRNQIGQRDIDKAAGRKD